MNRFVFVLLALAVWPLSASAEHRYDDRYGRYDDRYGDRDLVTCHSNDHRTRVCRVDVRGGVRLVRQESRSACVEGRTWGYDRRGIWVTRGCRATFAVGGRYGRPGYGDGYGPGPGYGYGGQVLRCESVDQRPRLCRVPGGVRRAQIVRQLSRTPCDYDYTWGFQRDGIWVERGCRAEFRVY